MAADLLSVLGVSEFTKHMTNPGHVEVVDGLYGFCMGRLALSQNVLGPTLDTSKKNTTLF